MELVSVTVPKDFSAAVVLRNLRVLNLSDTDVDSVRLEDLPIGMRLIWF